ncbi:MAG: hypothetical protein MJZ30_00690 [Paludibacteraceae bacterium]|nr:hypothetical protein [Paludibacteraceae bacterium]
MAATKVQIVLDADVIIHFSKGDLLSTLPDFLPMYDFVVLDKVMEEINEPIKTQLNKQISLLKNIRVVDFGTTAEERKEYAMLTSKLFLGKGESACMAYCRFNHDVVGSSNLKDIANYCKENSIVYLTTLDFLHYGISSGKITDKEANEFISVVNDKGSKLPIVDMSVYHCSKMV